MEQIQRKRRQAGTLGKYFYVFILPAFIVYLLFSIVPFLYTFYYSFTDYTDMNPVNLSFVGLKNYIKVFNTPLMMTAIKNSVIYAIMLTSLQTILALPLAVLLDLLPGRIQFPDHRLSVELHHVVVGLRPDQQPAASAGLRNL